MPFCIAGMHRSGTSMLSHMLSLCGVNMGTPEDLDRQPYPSNPEGHWENKAFRDVNDRLLASLGGAWDYPPALPQGWTERTFSSQISEQARQLVTRYSTLGVWGWKDPRNSLLLAFWKPLIPGLKVVVCVRGPMEVASSLASRGFTSELLALDLWTKYYGQLLEDTARTERLATHYESLLKNPEFELRRIARYIGLDPQGDSIQRAHSIVKGELRHHTPEAPLEGVDLYLPSEIVALYRDLCAECGIEIKADARTGASDPSLAGDHSAKPQPRSPGWASSLLVERQTQLDALEARSKQQAARLAELEALTASQALRLRELDSLKGEVDQLKKTLAARESDLVEARDAWTDLGNELDQIHASTGVRFLQRYWSLRDRFLPPGSFRRSLYEVARSVVRGLLRRDPSTLRLAAHDLRQSPRRRRGPASSEPIGGAGSVSQAGEAHPISLTYQQMVRSATNSEIGDYVPLAGGEFRPDPALPRLIAFYLPQFHPIPENDAWWGKGFTEWSNVSKAVPQFVGHYQPRLPGELGFYDLRVLDVQRRQIEMARTYGISGFCFHYYWFGGKRLLERPLDQFLEHPDLDFPFCLCWANENWTRRWDGAESEVLIAQEHTPQTDLQFMSDITPILKDPRYLRIGGRPLLIVYRPSILPDPVKTASAWRQYGVETGIGEPYLVAAQTFGLIDPRPLGFDAAVQFPPHNTRPRPVQHKVRMLNPDYHGHIHDYEELVDRMTREKEEPAAFDLFRTVFPGWDNEPRRPGAGRTFIKTSPETYRRWLTYAIERTMEKKDPEKQLVFINAWNEWAEGAYLEPDRRYGYAFLQATADALASFDTDAKVNETRSNRTALIATIPRSGTLMLVTFLKMYDYLIGTPDPTSVEASELFRNYDDARFRNLGFRSLHIGHGYCPGYDHFGEGETKKTWDAIEDSPHWFDEAGSWIRKNRALLDPQINPGATICFVYRNPFDFVVSMYGHFEHHRDRPAEWPMSMDDFIDMVMPQYLKSYVSYLEASRRYPNAIQLVSYRTLMGDRSRTLRSMLSFLRRPVGPRQEAAFEAALNHTEPPAMRELELFLGHTLAEDQQGDVRTTSHMRGGEVGKYQDQLEPEHVARIVEHLARFNLRPEDFGVSLGEFGSRDDPDAIYRTFHDVPDDDWIEMIVHCGETPVVRGVRLPGLPPVELQWNFVGRVGEETLRYGARFYREIKSYCRARDLPLSPGSRVVDFGCGFGRHLRFFLKDVHSEGLLGLDVNPRALDACRSALPMCQVSAIQPLPPAPIADASCDLIYSHSVFSHLSEAAADAWVAEFSRWLRPGGLLILTTHSSGLIDYAADLRNRRQWSHPWEEAVARNAFLDPAAAHSAYQRGDFLFARTEAEGGAFDPRSYGTAIIPPGYVQGHWTADFQLVDFVDDKSRLEQAIIVLAKKHAAGTL